MNRLEDPELLAIYQTEVRDVTGALDLSLRRRQLPDAADVIRHIDALRGGALSLGFWGLASALGDARSQIAANYGEQTVAAVLQALEQSLHREIVLLGWDVQKKADALGVFLHPGNVFVSAKPVAVTTILGSCVSVALFDREHSIGGINHFLIASSSVANPSLKYGDAALPALMSRCLAAGASKRHMTAAVVGGGSVLEAFEGSVRGPGRGNIELALAYLKAEAVEVVFQDTGGAHARKLKFETSSGRLEVNAI